MASNPSKTDKFVQMAINLPFPEVKDDRGERSVPELVKVATLRDEGSVQEAIEYAKALMKMYPDNDLIPFMVAYIYYQKQYPQEAIQTALDAIPNCPRKYRLYSVAGLAEFDRDRLPEALVWWSRSVIAQCMVTDYQDHDPFMHLGHAATVIGDRATADLFFTMTDAIDPTKPRLEPDFVDKLIPLREHWVKPGLVRVFAHIVKNHLHG